jgi:subtilisin family serine protease
MINAVAREAYERGVIWVCAAGNEVETVVAPAMYPGTIAVAAINPSGRPWKGSSNGKAVDIAAPGEDVYVPFWDTSDNEIMVYGNGTSYATPHVAAAAVLWKARNYDKLRTTYNKPWQIVEAFRRCLHASAQKHHKDTKEGVYGKGILDVTKLLTVPLPDLKDEDHAYAKVPPPDPGDLGIREGLQYLWNTFKRKLTKDPTESMAAALEAMGGLPSRKAMESAITPVPIDQAKLLREMFQPVR